MIAGRAWLAQQSRIKRWQMLVVLVWQCSPGAGQGAGGISWGMYGHVSIFSG